MMGLVETELPGFEWLKDVPKLKPEQIVYVGLRDVDIGEKKILRDLNIKALTMNAVDKYGIGKTMEMALDHLGDRPLHLSYDIDAIDPGEPFESHHRVPPQRRRSGRDGPLPPMADTSCHPRYLVLILLAVRATATGRSGFC